MRIAHVSWLLSSAGGGIPPAMIALAQAQTGVGESARILGIEDSRSPPLRTEVPCTTFPARGPLSLGWAPALSEALRGDSPDLVHLHGLFTWPSHAVREWRRITGRPVVVSPHGMLDPWALARSAWKKRIFSWLVENDNLRGAACLHALCEPEAMNIRRLGYSNPIAVIPNGFDLSETEDPPPTSRFGQLFPRASSRRLLLFLGRIHPKKGLLDLLRAWAAMRDEGRVKCDDWLLTIAGPDQVHHAAQVKKLSVTLGVDDHVLFTGPLLGDAKRAALAAADGFVLPSFSEGFAIAVLEALAWRLPVIVTRQCNFDAESIDAGWVCEPGDHSVADALRRFLSASDKAREEMGSRGRKEIQEHYTWPRIARQFLQVYNWLVTGAQRPPCVEPHYSLRRA